MFQTDPKYADLFLTSIMKGMKQGVEAVVKDAAADKFDNTPYVGTLENGGVGLAPFHNFEDKVDPALQGELDAIKTGHHQRRDQGRVAVVTEVTSNTGRMGRGADSWLPGPFDP